MEENNNGELTFKMIWQRIKESGVRIIVYCLIAVIVMGGILGVCDIFVSQSQYETNVTYFYSGVEDGKDPWGGSTDVISDIKSVNNVSSALQSLEYSEEEIDALVGLIIRNLNIIASTHNEVTAEDGTTLSANYSFRIVLSQDAQIDSHLKLRNDYNNIVNAITTTHINNFKSKYSIGTSLTKLESVESYNYFKKVSAIDSYLKLMKGEISTWQKTAPDFISTSQNINFATLNARVDGAALKLESYLNHILFNGIETNNESEYIELRLQSATDLITIYDEEITKQKEVLATLMQNPDTTVSGGGTIIVTPPDEKVLKVTVDAIAAAIENKRNAQEDKNKWTNYKNYFDASGFNSLSEEQKQSLIATANSLETLVLAEVNAVIDSYKAMTDEYNAGYNVSSLVRMSSVPHQSINSPITMKTGVIVELVTIVLATIVAMFVTNKKGKLVLKRKKKMEEQPEQAEVVLIGDKNDVPQQEAQQEIALTPEIEGRVEEVGEDAESSDKE